MLNCYQRYFSIYQTQTVHPAENIACYSFMVYSILINRYYMIRLTAYLPSQNIICCNRMMITAYIICDDIPRLCKAYLHLNLTFTNLRSRSFSISWYGHTESAYRVGPTSVQKGMKNIVWLSYRCFRWKV